MNEHLALFNPTTLVKRVLPPSSSHRGPQVHSVSSVRAHLDPACDANVVPTVRVADGTSVGQTRKRSAVTSFRFPRRALAVWPRHVRVSAPWASRRSSRVQGGPRFGQGGAGWTDGCAWLGGGQRCIRFTRRRINLSRRGVVDTARPRSGPRDVTRLRASCRGSRAVELGQMPSPVVGNLFPHLPACLRCLAALYSHARRPDGAAGRVWRPQACGIFPRLCRLHARHRTASTGTSWRQRPRQAWHPALSRSRGSLGCLRK